MGANEMKKYAVAWSVLVFTLLLTSCKKDTKLIEKDGVGMFELATSCSVVYNGKRVEITDQKIVSTLSSMCDNTSWRDADEIEKKNCNLLIEFVDARATLYINTATCTGYLNEIPVNIDCKIMSYIFQNIINEEL